MSNDYTAMDVLTTAQQRLLRGFREGALQVHHDAYEGELLTIIEALMVEVDELSDFTLKRRQAARQLAVLRKHIADSGLEQDMHKAECARWEIIDEPIATRWRYHAERECSCGLSALLAG